MFCNIAGDVNNGDESLFSSGDIRLWNAQPLVDGDGFGSRPKSSQSKDVVTVHSGVKLAVTTVY